MDRSQMNNSKVQFSFISEADCDSGELQYHWTVISLWRRESLVMIVSYVHELQTWFMLKYCIFFASKIFVIFFSLCLILCSNKLCLCVGEGIREMWEAWSHPCCDFIYTIDQVKTRSAYLFYCHKDRILSSSSFFFTFFPSELEILSIVLEKKNHAEPTEFCDRSISKPKYSLVIGQLLRTN